jgi:hypothetical protein
MRGLQELTAITLLPVFMIGFLFDVNPIHLLAQLIQVPVFQVVFLGTAFVIFCYTTLKYIVSKKDLEQASIDSKK